MQSGHNYSNNYPFRSFKSVKSSSSQSLRYINKLLKVKCLSEPQICKLEGNSGKEQKPLQVTQMEKKPWEKLFQFSSGLSEQTQLVIDKTVSARHVYSWE